MPLRLAEAPAGGFDVVREGIRRLLARGPGSHGALKAALPEALGLLAPHPVFDLGLDDVAAGKTAESARPGGTRYLVSHDDGSVAVAEIRPAAAGSGTGPTLAHIESGPFVAGTERAIAAAERDAGVAAGSFELRLLRIAALHVLALWLRNDAGGEDLFVPLAPAPPFLVPEVPIPGAAFFAPLAAAAREAVAKGSAFYRGSGGVGDTSR